MARTKSARRKRSTFRKESNSHNALKYRHWNNCKCRSCRYGALV